MNNNEELLRNDGAQTYLKSRNIKLKHQRNMRNRRTIARASRDTHRGEGGSMHRPRAMDASWPLPWPMVRQRPLSTTTTAACHRVCGARVSMTMCSTCVLGVFAYLRHGTTNASVKNGRMCCPVSSSPSLARIPWSSVGAKGLHTRVQGR